MGRERPVTHFLSFGHRPPEPGDLALQSGIVLLSVPAVTFLLAALYMMLHPLGRIAGTGLQLGGFCVAAVLAYPYGRTTFKTSLLIALGVYALSLATCAFFVDLSYDGQDYHYTAIWALAHGWDPYRGADFGNFVAPGSDWEPWARHYPKGDWLYLAVEAASGLGYETAKNSGVLLAAAAALCTFGVLRKLGLRPWNSGMLAVCAAANPITLTQLFMRMCDGRLGSLTAVFVCLGALAVYRREWRYLPPALLALTLAINTKFSMIPIFTCLGVAVCAAVWLNRGLKPAAIGVAVLVVCVLFATFIVGWDPYLRNAVRKGHPFYPVMGKNHIDTMWDSRPVSLLPHHDLTRLGMSLAAATGYEGPVYKVPMTLTREEFDISGDPEPRFAGFGPFFLPALASALASVLLLMFRRPHTKAVAAILLVAATGVLLSTIIMPESWLARYVPQFWLCPVLIAAAAMTSNLRSLSSMGWLTASLLLLDSVTVGASSLIRESNGSLAIHRQIAELRAHPHNLCANFGGTPARWAMLTDAGLQVAIRETPPPARCIDVQSMPYVFFETGDALGDICHCPTQ
jgi:hypothetical protein